MEERKESFQRVYRELQAAGCDGLFLLIDELSEFFCSKPTSQSLNEDACTLQFLGELAAERPLWIVAAVQESIEATGDIAQSTFRKIKDRFPVKLSLSIVHVRSLISERLVVKKPGAEEEIYRLYQHYRDRFPGISCSFDEFRQLYPLHPATIALLDGLGELFSQHRGIVDFVHSRIAGDSRRGIPSILERPPGQLLAPDSIYEHFAARLAEFSALLTDPGGTSAPGHLTLWYCTHISHCEGFHRTPSFEARSHGFCNRCLRFTAAVTRVRARLASGCWPSFAGLGWLPTGLLRKVPVYSHPPFPSFPWRERKAGIPSILFS